MHEAAYILFRRAAYGETIDLDGWNSYSDRDRLTVLAARAYTFIEFQIVAYHGDSSQYVGAVSDQCCALDRRGNLAIFDQVSLGSRKNKLAIRNIHLATAEIHGIDATFDGMDDVLRIVITGKHVSVGHARHGNVLVTFAASIAGVGDTHQPS